MKVRDKHRDSRVVAVIELVSPRNKDRVESRRAFAAKCSAYLQQGLGVVLVDVVSSSHKNLHNELMHLLEPPTPATMSDEVWLYASAYRPIQREEQSLIDIWIEELTLDEELPTLPLALRGNGLVPLDLQSTYTLACTRSRL